MSADWSITIAFLQRQPAAAARALQELDPADATALLEQVPAGTAGPVLEIMAPWAAATCLENLEPSKAAALVRAMSTQGGASVTRLLPDALRSSVMEHLPRSAARALGATLAYPRDTVGSWMDHRVPTFLETARAREALRYLRTRRRKSGSVLFVVDAERQFVGVVDVADLLRAEEEATLADVVDRDVTPLSNRARLSSVVAAPGWDRFNVLPVVGRRQNFLGALSRGLLQTGLSEGHAQRDKGDAVSLLAHLGSAYLVTALGTVQTIAAAGPRAAVETEKEEAHER